MLYRSEERVEMATLLVLGNRGLGAREKGYLRKTAMRARDIDGDHNDK